VRSFRVDVNDTNLHSKGIKLLILCFRIRLEQTENSHQAAAIITVLKPCDRYEKNITLSTQILPIEIKYRQISPTPLRSREQGAGGREKEELTSIEILPLPISGAPRSWASSPTSLHPYTPTPLHPYTPIPIK
jgi:hypothetical protein